VIHAAVATIIRGWAQRDLAVLREGIAQYEGAGQYVASSFYRALLVEGLLEQDRVEDALAELVIVEAFVERSGERRHLPELHRLGGRVSAPTRPAGSRRRGPPLREWRCRSRASRGRGSGSCAPRRRWRLCARPRGARRRPTTSSTLAMDGFDDGCDLPDLRRARALRAAS
jgi:hypothetical protein